LDALENESKNPNSSAPNASALELLPDQHENSTQSLSQAIDCIAIKPLVFAPKFNTSLTRRQN
jgi:hypothetical protein